MTANIKKDIYCITKKNNENKEKITIMQIDSLAKLVFTKSAALVSKIQVKN